MSRGVRAVLIEVSSLLALAVVCWLAGRLPFPPSIRSGTTELLDGTRIQFHSWAEHEEIGSKYGGRIASTGYESRMPLGPLVSQIALFTGLGLYACVRNRGALRERLAPRLPHLGLVAAGAVAVPAATAGCVYSMQAIGIEPPDRQAWVVGQLSDWPILTCFIVAVLGPIAEELYFRGWLFDGLSPRLGTLGVAWATSLAFAIAHGSAVLFPVFLVTGLALAGLRIWSGGLVVPMLVHMLHNGGMIAYTLIAGVEAGP